MPRQPSPQVLKQYVDEKVASEVLGISIPALQADRGNGQLGIEYHKFGSRVRYDLDTLYNWADARRRQPPGGQKEPAAAE
jgi:hypothetical protein